MIGRSKSRSLLLRLLQFSPQTLFAYRLPLETVVRVWDLFLVDGLAAIHRVGLALVSLYEGPKFLSVRSIPAAPLPNLRNRRAIDFDEFRGRAAHTQIVPTSAC